jgi:hypothetical protein
MVLRVTICDPQKWQHLPNHDLSNPAHFARNEQAISVLNRKISKWLGQRFRIKKSGESWAESVLF